MKTQIAKWGNSMAVRIPKTVADAANLRPGDYVEMTAEGLGVVRLRKKKGKESLKDLIREISPANVHTETDWTGPEGKERW
jgi:antitoxin MazE